MLFDFKCEGHCSHLRYLIQIHIDEELNTYRKSLAYNLGTLSPITHHSGSGDCLTYILAPPNVV